MRLEVPRHVEQVSDGDTCGLTGREPSEPSSRAAQAESSNPQLSRGKFWVDSMTVERPRRIARAIPQLEGSAQVCKEIKLGKAACLNATAHS